MPSWISKASESVPKRAFLDAPGVRAADRVWSANLVAALVEDWLGDPFRTLVFGVRLHLTVRSKRRVAMTRKFWIRLERLLTRGWRFALFSAAVSLECLMPTSVALPQPRWAKAALNSIEGANASKNAPAIVWEEIKVRFRAGPESERTVKRVIKARKSLREEQSVSWVLAPEEQIKKFDAWVVRKDGQVRHIKKKDIVAIASPDAAGYYTDTRFEIAYITDELRSGDAIVEEWTLTRSGLGACGYSYSPKLRYPYRLAELDVEVPKGWVFRASKTNDSLFHHVKLQAGGIWAGKDLPYIDLQIPYLPPLWHLRPAVFLMAFDSCDTEMRVFNSWHSVGRWLWSLFGPHLKVDSMVFNFSKGLQGDLWNRALAACHFARDSVRYVAVEIGKAGYEPSYPSFVLEKRYGDCKDKATFLVSVLRELGFEAHVALCNTERYILPNFPDPFAFNHAIVAIKASPKLPDGLAKGLEYVFFDATNHLAEPGDIPDYLPGDHVFVIDSAGGIFCKVPANVRGRSGRKVTFKAVVANNGDCTIRMKFTDTGHLARKSLHFVRRQSIDEQKKEWRSFLEKENPGKRASIIEYSYKADWDSVTYWVTAKLYRYADLLGDLLSLKVDPVHKPRAPLLKSDRRTFPIWFGEGRKTIVRGEWSAPDGWQFEAVLDSAKVKCKAGEISYRIKADRSKASILYTRDFNDRVMKAAEIRNARKVEEAWVTFSQYLIFGKRSRAAQR